MHVDLSKNKVYFKMVVRREQMMITMIIHWVFKVPHVKTNPSMKHRADGIFISGISMMVIGFKSRYHPISPAKCVVNFQTSGILIRKELGLLPQ